MKPAASVLLKTVCFAALFCVLAGPDTASGQPITGSGTATINGVLGSGEWSNAGTANLTVNLPDGEGGGTATGKLYVMNDSSTLYLAIKVDRNLKNTSLVSVFFEFDNDNDGIKEDGDELLLVNFSPTGPPGVQDRVREGQDSSSIDTDVGGTSDLEAKGSLDGTYSFLEISHPLNSADDANDFSLTAGQVVGFKYTSQIWNGGGAQTSYPTGAVQFAQIQISGTSGPEPPLTQRSCFPQFGAGAGMTSQIVLTNPSQHESATAQVQLTDDLGASLSVDFNGLASGSSFVIAPLGSVTLRSIDPGQLKVGSAIVMSSRELGGTIRFEISGMGIAGVGSGLPVHGFIAPVRRKAGAISTGVAIQNLGVSATPLEFTLRNGSGQPVAQGVYVIANFPARGHLAKFINELFPNAQLDNFEGTLVVTSPVSEIAATVMELGSKPGEFTTLPVIALTE